MARFDKYDPYVGGFRATVAVNYPDADLGALFGFGINSSGQAVKGAGQTGIIGVHVNTQKPGRVGPNREVSVIDIMQRGCITDFGPSNAGQVPGVNYGVAGTQYYSDANGVITSSATQNALQQFQIGAPTAGTYTATYNGQTTAAIAYNAGASGLQTALAALSNIGTGNVVVSGAGTAASPFVVQFVGTLVGQPGYVLTVNGAGLTGGTVVQPAAQPSTYVGTTVEADRLQVSVLPWGAS